MVMFIFGGIVGYLICLYQYNPKFKDKVKGLVKWVQK